MAITDYAEYVAKSNNPHQCLNIKKNSVSSIAGRTMSSWLAAPFAGVAPTTAVAPTRSTVGALQGFENGATLQRLARAEASISNSGTMILADRLSHQGGLSGTVIAAQTTNLPTAALTRYTSGVGVMIALEIYTAIGATGTTVTASYTNTTPTAGRTTVATVFGGTGYNTASRFIILPLQQGDVGVTSVESVTVLTSTATIGNFGVTLFKPLFMFALPNISQQQTFEGGLNMAGNMAAIENNACLFWIPVSQSTASGEFHTTLSLIEDT